MKLSSFFTCMIACGCLVGADVNATNLVDQVIAKLDTEVYTLRDLKMYALVNYLDQFTHAPADPSTFEQHSNLWSSWRDEFVESAMIVQFQARYRRQDIVSSDKIEKQLSQISAAFSDQAQMWKFFKVHNMSQAEVREKIKHKVVKADFFEQYLTRRFIVSEQEVYQFFDNHRLDLFAGKSVQEVRSDILVTLTDKKIQDEYVRWLASQRSRVKLILLPWAVSKKDQ